MYCKVDLLLLLYFLTWQKYKMKMHKFYRFSNDKNMTKFSLKLNIFSLVPIIKSIIIFRFLKAKSVWKKLILRKEWLSMPGLSNRLKISTILPLRGETNSSLTRKFRVESESLTRLDSTRFFLLTPSPESSSNSSQIWVRVKVSSQTRIRLGFDSDSTRIRPVFSPNSTNSTLL